MHVFCNFGLNEFVIFFSNIKNIKKKHTIINWWIVPSAGHCKGEQLLMGTGEKGSVATSESPNLLVGRGTWVGHKLPVTATSQCSTYGETSYCNLMHRIVDALEHHQHTVQRLLQLPGTRSGVAESKDCLLRGGHFDCKTQETFGITITRH